MLKRALSRKRKMVNSLPCSFPSIPLLTVLQRCDGSKPACQQCTRAKLPEGCHYDDGKGKTRTQLLRENIERLEQRIRELEDSEHTSQSIILHDPHHHRRSESSSSSLTGSPASTGFISHSPFPPSGMLTCRRSLFHDNLNISQ